MTGKWKQPKIEKHQPQDRLKQLQDALTDGEKPRKKVLRAFDTLMRQNEEDDTWAQKEFRQSKERKKS